MTKVLITCSLLLSYVMQCSGQQCYTTCPSVCTNRCSPDTCAGTTSQDWCSYPTTGCPDDWLNVGSGCCELPLTPILIDVAGTGFTLTDAAHGVDFDFFGNGQRVRLAWTTPGSQNGWLVLDRNGDGTIDSSREMFGNATSQPRSPNPNGFLALEVFDDRAHGGNDDGLIDKNDAIFPSLRVWIDLNHDGISQADELYTLSALAITSISLKYSKSPWVDHYGNRFRYKAVVDDATHAHVGRFAFDVFLTKLP
jgi:hypothetical protein